MKSRFLFVPFSVLLIAVASCDVERSEKYQTLLAERDSLYTEAVAAKGGYSVAIDGVETAYASGATRTQRVALDVSRPKVASTRL